MTGVAVSSALSRFQRQVSLASLAAGVFWTYLVLVAGAWAVLDGSSRIDFDPTPDTLWDRLIKLAGGLQARATARPGRGIG